ncbi:sugar-binding transcriptional regulator [Dermatophilus congolensis]|uniref:sugar-binding transcriptional regulator n=1 Tax=Dermatophilus congolensis TaxID=1863 RepID=UPI0004858584|nr:sugar-binding domain-containing protein [Dermatophilus congolensis]
MDERQMVEVARSYYVVGETMEVIAARLGVSRSSVSRLLARAREVGVVRISIVDGGSAPRDLQRHLDRARVRAHVVDVRPTSTPLARLDAVARTAGALVSECMHDGASLGVAWGTTVAAVVEQLPPRPLRNVSVVQLNGAASAQSSGITFVGEILGRAAQAYGARVHHFPMPAFFDYAESRRALLRERSVQRVVAAQQRLDVALFGIGAFASELPSHVYSHDYLSRADVERLGRLGVVGDVCTVFLREDGTYADIELNRRATGPTPAVLGRLPRRIGAVTGTAKVPAVVGALRSGALTDLVVDSVTAAALTRRLDARPLPVRREPGAG